MTEFELIEAVNSTMSINGSLVLGYSTVISAYLVAAFVAGEKLNWQQFAIVSILFVFFSGSMVFALWGTGSRVAYLAEALRSIDPQHPIRYTYGFRNGVVVITGVGILASLKFMWDIRRSKIE